MWIGLTVGMGFYALFGIVPAVATVVVSLTNYSGLQGAPTAFTGLEQFKAAFTTEAPLFFSAVQETLVFVVGVTVLQTVGALILAHRLREERRGDGILRSLIFMPTVLGATVISLLWLLIFDPAQGPITAIGNIIGFQSAFFGSNALAMPLVIFVQSWAGIGFGTLVFIGGLKAIPDELYEAGAIDGAQWWVRFRTITWPLIAPSTTVVVLLSMVGSFTTYNIIYVLTDGQFGTDTLGMLSFTSAFGGSAELGYGAAMSIILFVMTLVVALPLQRWLRRRELRAIG